jgi:lactoylglutathione lyase
MARLTVPRLKYTGLRVSDMKRSIAFYTEALDMKLQFRFTIKETGGKVAYLKSPGGRHVIELNWYPNAGAYRRGDQLDHLGFNAPDLKAVHTKILAHGGKVTIPTFREGSTMLTFYEDPDGIPIEIGTPSKGRFRAKGGKAWPKPPRK